MSANRRRTGAKWLKELGRDWKSGEVKGYGKVKLKESLISDSKVRTVKSVDSQEDRS